MRKHHSKRPVVRRLARLCVGHAAATLCIFGFIGTTSSAYAAGGGQGGAVADHFALAQMGKPYAYGAAGPGAFDCSGLVYDAWRTAGVAEPRVAAAQYNAGQHVTLDHLQPGDLMFWATNPRNPATIYHVAMYVGFGAMVHAPHPGARVTLMPVHSWYPNVPLATRP